MKKTFYFASLFLIAFAFQIQAQTKPKVFRGTVGESRIQISLIKDDDKLSGNYYYQKIGTDIKLSGTIDREGKFKLEEFGAKDAKTGEFKGNWSESEESGKITLTGTWSDPKNTKRLDFYADEQMIFFTGAAKLLTKTTNESNKPKMFEITAEYPELAGVDQSVAAKFNALSKNALMKPVNEFRKDMLAQTAEDLKFAKERGVSNYSEITYNVEYADDKIISIWFGNHYYTGGAHPNSFSFTLNFDLKTGRKIELAELFKPDSGYLQKISGYCIKDLQARLSEASDDEWIKTGADAKAENYKNWNITKNGLLISFDAYQVAAYVAGPQEVLIPYSELKNILRDGVIPQS